MVLEAKETAPFALYHDRKIIADGVVPDDLIATSANFLPACVGANPPYGVRANIVLEASSGSRSAPGSRRTPRSKPTSSRSSHRTSWAPTR